MMQHRGFFLAEAGAASYIHIARPSPTELPLSADLRDQLQASLGSAYTIERELGGGGMSRVFAATETSLGRHVVAKILPPEMAEGESVERFKREIQLEAQLRHPHIVRAPTPSPPKAPSRRRSR